MNERGQYGIRDSWTYGVGSRFDASARENERGQYGTGLQTIRTGADPREVIPGHITAATSLKLPMLGIVDKGKATPGLFILNRLREVFDSLIATHGIASKDHPGFPKLNGREIDQLIGQFLEAVKLGTGDFMPQAPKAPDGYVLSMETIGTGSLVRQSRVLEVLLNQSFGGVPTDFEKPTDLAKAVGEAVKQRFLARTTGFSPTFDPVPGISAVNILGGEMDLQGIRMKPMGWSDLGEEFKKSAAALPGKIAELPGKIADVLGLKTVAIIGLAVVGVVGGILVVKGSRSDRR